MVPCLGLVLKNCNGNAMQKENFPNAYKQGVFLRRLLVSGHVDPVLRPTEITERTLPGVLV